jgi:hypothetical protein
MPGRLQRYVEESARATNTRPDFTAVPLLGAAGGAVGNARRLEVKPSYHESACLWLVPVGLPGTGKSIPLCKFLAEPFHQTQAGYFREHEKKVAAWERAVAAKRPDRPAAGRCLVSDTTVEKVVRILAENQRGALLVRDEVSAFFEGLCQYKRGKGNDAQFYLEFWSGTPVTYDRSHLGDKCLSVPFPFLPILGTIQPDTLVRFRQARLAEGYRDDGLFDRLLFSYPEPLAAKGEEWLSLSSDSRDLWRRIVGWLMRLKMDGRQGNKRPRDVYLTADARAEWERVTWAHADETNAADFPLFLRGPWAKMCPAYLGRLALILQLLRCACGEAKTTDVDGRSVRDAEVLVNYFKAHKRRCYTVMAADAHVGEALLVLRWLRGRPDVTEFRRSAAWDELRHSIHNQRPGAGPADLNRPLSLLVEHNYLARADPGADGPKGPGRKPTDGYTVNPRWDRSDQNDQYEQLPGKPNCSY